MRNEHQAMSQRSCRRCQIHVPDELILPAEQCPKPAELFDYQVVDAYKGNPSQLGMQP
jgi:hypothetical protein